MEKCERIEIVIERPLAPKVAAMLDELAVPGYTLIDSASGCGDRGLRRADEIAGISTNSVFIVACDEAHMTQAIVERLRPLLSVSGGLCLVSEAYWVKH